MPEIRTNVQNVPPSVDRCPHIPAAHLARFPCSACDACRAFVDRDGALMTPELAERRYPQLVALIRQQRLAWPEPPSRAMEGVRLAGAISRSLLAIIFAGLALVVVIVLLVAAVR